MFNAILQVIIAIPKIYGLVKELILWSHRNAEKKKRDGFNQSVDQAQAAQTKEELWRANENQNRNLP